MRERFVRNMHNNRKRYGKKLFFERPSFALLRTSLGSKVIVNEDGSVASYTDDR
jgi:hypothetical protein